MASPNDANLRDEDRLPWLETVDEDYDDGPSAGRIIALVLIGLAVIAAVIGGYAWYQKRQATDGSGALIAAQEGDYKVRPDDPGGLNVTGEGDTAIATSAGQSGNSSVDMAAQPETPVAGHRARPTPLPTNATTRVVTEVPGPSAPVSAPAAAASGAIGSTVQLGSFPTAAAANSFWGTISHRFGFLAPIGHSVQQAQVNGATVYRVRVNAGAGQAVALCDRIKSGGGTCFVPTS